MSPAAEPLRPPTPNGNGLAALIGQKAAVEALQRAIDRNRLPHAMILAGPPGIGKATCAGLLAQALNCPKQGPRDACGICISCSKVARGLHPDVMWIAPEPSSIRKQATDLVVRAVGYTPHEGSRRVVVIDGAHLMTASAQNALLKTLEEPPPSSTILLVTSAPRRLLATVRSRCQALLFRPLSAVAIQSHLEGLLGVEPAEARLRAALASGSIGSALRVDIDAFCERRAAVEAALMAAEEGGSAIITAAEELLAGERESTRELAAKSLRVARSVLRDLLVLAIGSDGEPLVNIDRAEEWRSWARRLDIAGLTRAVAAAERSHDRFVTGIQPNARMTVEQALIEIGSALTSDRPTP